MLPTTDLPTGPKEGDAEDEANAGAESAVGDLGWRGAILKFNLAAMVVDTDLRALGQDTLLWVRVSGDVRSAIYLLEFTSRLFVEQRELPRSTWNRLDYVVVYLGIM